MAILPFTTKPSDPFAPSEPLLLPDEGRNSRTYWKKELDAAQERLDQVSPDWDRNVLRYRAKSLSNDPKVDTVVVPRDFSYVEQKKAQVFFQVPEVHLTPLQDGLEGAVPVFQAVVNKYLGADDINALATMQEVTFDLLCPSALMCSVIGYENFTDGMTDVQTGEQPDPEHVMAPSLGQPDPTQLPGSVLGIGTPAPEPPMVPVMEQAPNIVHQRYFFTRLSPKATLIPASWSGSVYDRAPWLAYKAEDDWDVLKKRYKLSADMDIPRSRNVDDDKLKLPGEVRTATSGRVSTDKVTYTVIWYRTAFMDTTEAHPEKFRELVLCEGMDEPLVHRNSPFQQVNEAGELMGLRGNPIRIGSVRYVSDTAYPPSECSIGGNTVEELNKSRTQMLTSRDRSRPMRLVDLARIGGEPGMAKLRKNIDQALIPIDHLDKDNPPVVAVGLASYPPDDFAFNTILDRDLDTVWAMGANQRGQQTNQRASATEITKIDQWAETRLDAERRGVLAYFLYCVRGIAELIQLFATEPEFIRIVGQDKVARLQQWDKHTIQGRYAFDCSPDSAIRIDQAQARTESLKMYELLRKDPNMNGVELLEWVCAEWNLDPKKFVVAQLPPKGPDPANVSFRFNAQDLDVRNPNFPLYISIMQQAGYKIDQTVIGACMHWAQYQAGIGVMASTGQPPSVPQPGPQLPGVMPMQPHEHAGTAPKSDHINAHRAAESSEPVGRPPMIDTVQ